MKLTLITFKKSYVDVDTEYVLQIGGLVAPSIFSTIGFFLWNDVGSVIGLLVGTFVMVLIITYFNYFSPI